MVKQRMKTAIAAVTGAAVFFAWVGVAAAWAVEAPGAVFTGAVVIAAFATEGAIWVAAIVLGWSIFENRRALLRRLTGRGGGDAEEGKPV